MLMSMWVFWNDFFTSLQCLTFYSDQFTIFLFVLTFHFILCLFLPPLSPHAPPNAVHMLNSHFVLQGKYSHFCQRDCFSRKRKTNTDTLEWVCWEFKPWGIGNQVFRSLLHDRGCGRAFREHLYLEKLILLQYFNTDSFTNPGVCFPIITCWVACISRRTCMAGPLAWPLWNIIKLLKNMCLKQLINAVTLHK